MSESLLICAPYKHVASSYSTIHQPGPQLSVDRSAMRRMGQWGSRLGGRGWGAEERGDGFVFTLPTAVTTGTCPPITYPQHCRPRSLTSVELALASAPLRHFWPAPQWYGGFHPASNRRRHISWRPHRICQGICLKMALTMTRLLLYSTPLVYSPSIKASVGTIIMRTVSFAPLCCPLLFFAAFNYSLRSTERHRFVDMGACERLPMQPPSIIITVSSSFPQDLALLHLCSLCS